ncbi:phage antirepressor KilAC domain-containing protein [Peptostreptococcus porci]|uniref:phage antirepressor KilAC domain-containing protein n=1 Tax=Peptostreptococcus porci TaxID=2652282 RepID=UPI002A840311|nr:phage antirepressor KilAC domain-containing protein [Peptostreptococcus porci]MDY4127590.1 phage antirepressor KilAC domain-containing protein [Peptostreptococcus porci]
MDKIVIEGKQNFMGIEIPIISGGFGSGCKVISVNTISEVHGIEVRKINELINSNINEFEKGIDILDLKQDEESEVLAKDLGLITSNRQKYCYILSEQGYMLLVGFMKTDRAKEIRKQLRREYFQMREIINSQDQLRNQLLLQLFSNDSMVVANAHKQLLELETKPLLEKIEVIEPMADKYNIYLDTEGLTDVASFSKNLGVKGLGRNNMYKWLKDNEFLMNDNNPYQRYVNQEIFLVKPAGHHINSKGEKVQDFKTYITKKGVDYLINKLKEDNKIA